MRSRVSTWASSLREVPAAVRLQGARVRPTHPGKVSTKNAVTAAASVDPTKQQLADQLEAALAGDELRVHYQPRLDAATRTMVGVEALVRWEHPDRGLVSPAEFIPLAEETGLIVPLGTWVLREACRQVAHWMAEGRGALCVSVNVAAQQMTARFFEETVPQALAEAGLAPAQLELELTETASMDALEPCTLQAIQALRRQGVRIFLDDFGTGYSSLSYLHKLPLDGLKLDRSFVMRLTEAPDAQAIVKAILEMAAALNLSTVAEGIETEDQAAWLSGQDCHELQGFLFSKPLPPQALAATWLSGHAH